MPLRSARYLVRFDDICPTMNWRSWDRIEEELVDAGVAPMLSVIPDNRDEELFIDPPNPRFWEQVRAWRARGWTIGMHGYQHRYVTHERGLFGWDGRSEFAGLPFDQQDEKVRRAVEIFKREGVTPDVWVAPNHSFDSATLLVLKQVGIDIISDGHAVFPYRDAAGMVWVPMQLWRFLDRPTGIWTVCLHHNRWETHQLEAFARNLRMFGDRITDLPSVLERYGGRTRSLVDRLFMTQRKVKRRLARLRRR